MHSPKLSIIVPVYNTADYLPECLDCFLDQTYKNFEVVLVDDGSLDNSGEICDEYVRRDKRFRVLHQNNMGVSVARNAGIDAAEGDYVGFVDSDDTFLPGMLESYASIIEETGADIVQSANYISEVNLVKYRNQHFLHVLNNAESRRAFFTIGEVRPSVCLSFFKNDLIANMRFPAHIVQWEDYAFTGVMVSRASHVAVTSNLFYKYRHREGSATKQSLNDKHLTCLLIDDFFEKNSVYQSKQEKYDVVGFFVRCCVLGFLASANQIKNRYRTFIKKVIKDNKRSLMKCESVSLNMKIIILNVLISEKVSKIVLNIKYKAIQGILNTRNRLVSKS